MATLDEKIYELTQRATVDLRRNGQPILNWISIKGGDHEDNPVPYLDVELPSYEGFLRGQRLTCDAGYDNLHVRMFTGGIYSRGNEDPDALRTQCFVRGRTDDLGNTVEALASVTNPPVIWPPIPDGQYIDFEISDSLIWEDDNAAQIAGDQLALQAIIPNRPAGTPLSQVIHGLGDLKGAYRSYKIPSRDLSGMMIKDAMSQIYDDSGVSQYNLTDFDDYELAPSGVLVDRSAGSEPLSLLMLLRNIGHRQAPSGVVHHRTVDTRPSSTPAFTYDSNDPDFARVIDNPGTVRVPFNPKLQRGMTIRVVDSATQVSGNWYLRGHDWELGKNGDWSYMDLIGGDDLGVSIGINPEAHFSYWIEFEYVDGELMVIAQFDGQSSFDNDGTLVDTDLTWSDNQTPDLISGTGFRKTVVTPLADIVEPWIVNLEVEDATNLTGNEAQTIDLTFSGGIVQFPVIGYAGTNHSGFQSPTDTVDGWTDFTESTQCAVGMRPPDGVHTGHKLIGYLDGHVELTRDGNVTRIAVPSLTGDSRIRFIAWDWRNTSVCWVLTDQLQLWVCLDMDAATPVFGLYGGQSLRITLDRPNALGNLIGLPGAGGVYVFGATGTGFPLIAYDASITNNWVIQITIGDILTDGAGATNLRIVDYTAPGYGGDTMILGNAGGRANGSIAIYHSNDPPGPVKTWTRATGLPAGLVDGRAMLPNGPLADVSRIAFFGDNTFQDSAFKSLDGIAYTETTGIVPAGKVVNHAIWLSDVLTGLPAFDGIYLFALGTIAAGTGEIRKSVDECSTELDPVRTTTSDDPMPTNAQPVQLAIGPSSVATASGDAKIIVVFRIGGGNRWSSRLDGSPFWTPLVLINAVGEDAPPFPLKPLVIMAGRDGDNSYRSLDRGDTWAAMSNDVDDTIEFLPDANGVRIWAIRSLTVETQIWYTDNDGANWTLAKATGFNTREPATAAIHPITPGKFFIYGQTNTGQAWNYLHTGNDPTTGYTENTGNGNPKPGGDFQPRYGCQFLANNRVVVSGRLDTGAPVQWYIRYADPPYNAAAWVTSFFESNNGIGINPVQCNPFTGKSISQRTVTNELKFLISEDNAESFDLVDFTAAFVALTGDPNFVPEDFVYDWQRDAIIFRVTAVVATQGYYQILPANASGVMTNITGAVPDDDVNRGSMAVLV